jgi:hypothetical protein
MGNIALIAACALPAPAATTFKDVAIRCAASAKDTKLTGYTGELVLDDAGQAFTVRMEKPERRIVTIPYAEVLKAIADSDATPPIPGSSEIERHYWFYFERKPGANPERFVVEMGQDGASFLTKTRPLFGDRLQEMEFPMGVEMLDFSSTITDLNLNYSVRIKRPNPPFPAIPKGRALIVVVCPSVEDARKEPINLDANGRVVAVNEPGTYSFVNLDPGEYTMVSQAANARSMHVKLEPDKAYYFFQDLIEEGQKTGLSMHSKEVALFEISGALYSDWRREKY